jgi:transitional endoplasmic reticulum ATPase
MPIFDHDNEHSFLRLWILRILSQTKSLNRFVGKDCFRDEDIAAALGMVEWMEMIGGAFDQKRIIAHLELMQQHLEKAQPPLPGSLSQNCKVLCDALGLSSPVEQAILEFEVIKANSQAIYDALHISNVNTRFEYVQAVAYAINSPMETVEAIYAPDSIFFQASLLAWERNHRLNLSNAGISDAKLAYKLNHGICSINDLIQGIVSLAPAPRINYSCFPHIAESLKDLRVYLRKQLKIKKAGVNIFLYGPPGTGKSELSRLIAREMKTTLYEVAFCDGDGEPTNSRQRLSSLCSSQHLLGEKRSLLVFDEAEDIFRNNDLVPSFASSHKAWINRTLESNPIPTIWIANDIADLEPAFVRRFDLILEVSAVPKEIRKKSYQKILQLKRNDALLEQLAEVEGISPAILSNASDVAQTICQGNEKSSYRDALIRVLSPKLKAQGHDLRAIERPQTSIPNTYSLEYLNTDLELETFAKELKKEPACRLCFYGPPGTGKTSLGHWLAKELQRPLILKKASDLLSPYLGVAEKNMAAAFAEAEQSKGILMIDEVDSFLHERRDAMRSWEVTQVNEFLTQLQNFEGTFIASTNLIDNLDQAALRRFDLKVYFDYMNEGQVQKLLSRHCEELGLSRDHALEHQMQLPENCTPGDFANVSRQHRFRRFDSSGAFLNGIQNECKMKEHHGHKSLGFSPV